MKCKKCGAVILLKLNECPICGTILIRQMKFWHIITFFVLAPAIIYAFMGSFDIFNDINETNNINKNKSKNNFSENVNDFRTKKYNELVSKFGPGDGIDLKAIIMTYLDYTANDPKSIKIIAFSPVCYNDHGWVLGCDFRGKNAFGGLVKNSKWFTISNRKVINVEDYTDHMELPLYFYEKR
jgi:hypothetical protein